MSESRVALSKRTTFILAVMALLIGAALRIWQLPTLPVGLSDLEISHIDVMLDEVQRGEFRVFYERELPSATGTTGQEGLYHTVATGASLIFGTGTFGLRMVSILFGMITVAVMYALGTHLLNPLAGLIAAGFYSVLMFPVLLARLVIVEATLPLMVAVVMLTLVHAFPILRRSRDEARNTVDFAVLGVFLSLSLYLHQFSLFIVLMAMAFVTFFLISNRPVPLRRLSYIGFAILMLVIVAMPYALSTLRLSELGANNRILGNGVGMFATAMETALGIVWRGDSNPLHNLPERPLLDPISGFLLMLGLVFSLRKWRNAYYFLILSAVVILAVPVILAGSAPNFMALSILLPVLVLLISVGATHLILLTPAPWRRVSMVLVLVVWGGNLVWSIDSLFNRWSNLGAVQVAFNHDLGRIAHHLDLTADDIPAVICNPDWDEPRGRRDTYNDAELIKLHMNRDTVLLREVDCGNGFVFVNAGIHQQVVMVDPMQRDELYPLVADWLTLATPLEHLPTNTVFDMQVQRELEDALGVFTTTSPASYATRDDVSARIPVAPPIRFGGNVTWLGYEIDPQPEYVPNSVVPVATYWRIEGLVPSDFLVFTHLLSDPVTRIAQIDTIHIDPRELRERDVYLHNASIQLSPTVEAGDLIVSVGVYQESDNERLPVFVDEGETQGNRIFLYQIQVEPQEGIQN